MTIGKKKYNKIKIVYYFGKKEDVRLTKFLWKNVAIFVFVYSDNNNKLNKIMLVPFKLRI